MRIITGSARNTQLETLSGEETTRPTAERVKEAVFSAMQFDIAYTSFLDLFAGSGQMGLEALSRGATRAVLVDASPEAIAVIKSNAKKCRLFEKCRIVNYRYDEYLRGFTRSGEPPFDIIYVDPPFGDRIYCDVLRHLAASGACGPDTRIIVESETPDLFGGDTKITAMYETQKVSHYGRIYIHWLSMKA